MTYLNSILDLFRYDPANPMIFSSGFFLFLFGGFALIYGFMRRKPVLRMAYVALFSTYFYYKTGGVYFTLLIFVSITDYCIGRLMPGVGKKWVRKLLVILSLGVNLGMLAYFKYTNLFIEIVNGLAGSDVLAFRNIFLPVGISFFVFQSLSYTIDIYRGKLKPLTNWLDYYFYLSFFPQLVAGPIVRAKDFIPQIRQNPLRITREMFGKGLFLIMTGLVKKAIISDYISLNFVDRVFDNPMLYSGFENLMGVYGYALQIYCDFSGYSDMAIGIALLLGFRFPENFDSPYKSGTITEFWRRWHISLSSWLKDYLYISLGGNRRGRFRTYLNLMVTMLLGGLWHGAAMRFILWGGLHGVSLAIHKSYLPKKGGSRSSPWMPAIWVAVFAAVAMLCRLIFPGSWQAWALFMGVFAIIAIVMRLFPKASGEDMKPWHRILGIVFTFHIVCFGWIFFRAPNMGTGIDILEQIFTNMHFALIPEILLGYWEIFALILFGYILHYIPGRMKDKAKARVIKNSLIANAAIIVLIIWVIMQIKSSDIQPFIYFQF